MADTIGKLKAGSVRCGQAGAGYMGRCPMWGLLSSVISSYLLPLPLEITKAFLSALLSPGAVC